MDFIMDKATVTRIEKEITASIHKSIKKSMVDMLHDLIAEIDRDEIIEENDKIVFGKDTTDEQL